MRRIAIAIVTAIVLAVPIAAEAASASNIKADHGALGAYTGFLKSEVNRISIGKTDDAGLVRQISRGPDSCPDQLSGPVDGADTKAKIAALHAVGNEIGYDSALTFVAESHQPFRTLAAKLRHLRWKSRSARDTVSAFSSALRRLLALRPSKLCGDVLELKVKPADIPPGTKTFTAAYSGALTTLRSDETRFTALLGRYATASENRTIDRINRLANQFDRTSGADSRRAAQQLVKVLTR